MQVELCRHVKPNGVQCHAVALKTSVFCYFHRRLHDSHRVYRDTIVARPDLARRGAIFDLGTLEDRVAIQIAISKVVNALATNQIDLKHGRTLLYGLQLASANARNLEPVPEPHAVVREVHPSPGLLDETATDIAAPGQTTEVPEPELPETESAEPAQESPAAPEPTPAERASEPATPGLTLCAAADNGAERTRTSHHTYLQCPAKPANPRPHAALRWGTVFLGG
jgi:hypothetical protein